MFGIEELTKDELMVGGELITPLSGDLFSIFENQNIDLNLLSNPEDTLETFSIEGRKSKNSEDGDREEDDDDDDDDDDKKKKNRGCKGGDDDDGKCGGDDDRKGDDKGDDNELEIEGLKKAKEFFRNNDPLNLPSKFGEVEIEVETGKKGLNELFEIPNFANLLEEFGLNPNQLKRRLKGDEVEIERKKRFPNGTVVELELEGEEGEIELGLNITRGNKVVDPGGDCSPDVQLLGGTGKDTITGYDNVFISDRLTFTFSSPSNNGDIIDVVFNGETIAENLELTTQGTSVELTPLTTGPNRLQTIFKQSENREITVLVDVPTDTNFYGADSYEAILQDGCPLKLTIGLPRIRIPGRPDGEAGIEEGVPFVAQNILDTLGEPIKLVRDTVPNATKRRNKRVGDYTKDFGLIPKEFNRDEAPPAIGNDKLPQYPLPEPNVRAIPAQDNKDAGNIQKKLFNRYGPDEKRIPVGGVVDFYATTPNYPSGVTKIIPRYGTEGDDRLTPRPSPNNTGLVYGFGGNDTITGTDDSKDTLLGGFGDDIIRGRDKSDIIVGQPGEDVLFGGKGNDVVYGGPGNDVLYGSEDNDIFVLRKSPNEGIDLVRDFDFQKGEIIDQFDYSNDVFAALKFNQIIDGKRKNGENFIDDVLPDYPLVPKDEINLRGTEVFVGVGRNRQTLAYFEGVDAKQLNNIDLFANDTTKTSLPNPQGFEPSIPELLV